MRIEVSAEKRLAGRTAIAIGAVAALGLAACSTEQEGTDTAGATDGDCINAEEAQAQYTSV